MKVAVLVFAVALVGAPQIFAQAPPACRVLCTPEFKVEPTVTISNVFGSPRIVVDEQGTTTREPRETAFEVILSLGLPTRVSWLEFTIEAIFLPFDRESTPELEFETNLIWLPAERTRGWLSSHFDVVDKFSAAERPSDRRAYTHKLNFELDASLALFNWLPDARWLRSVELEGSLDYVATGLPAVGDRIDGVRFLDKASPWSFSIVIVLPVAPL
jgi:hypothetical protein